MDGLAHDELAENTVIGILMLDHDTVVKCELQPEHFFNDTYRRVWAGAQQAYRNGLPYTTWDAERDGLPMATAIELETGAISFTWLPTYAKAVLDAYAQRQAQLFAARMLELTHQEDFDVEDAREMAGHFATMRNGSDNAITEWETLPEEFNRDLEYYRKLRESNRIPNFPWATWNSVLGEPEVGMLIFLAAAESTGKTVYAECIAEHWAKQGLRVGFYHHELHARVMRRRRMARHTGIPDEVLRTGKLTPVQCQQVSDANYALSQWSGGIDYVHAPGWTMDQIIRTAEVQNFDAIIIDYVQKVSPTAAQAQAGRYDIVRWGPMAMEDLKNYCERTETYSLVLSQITAEGKRSEPSMNDIRWWKELSEKANMGIIAWREVADEGERVNGQMVTNPGSKSIYVHVKVEKNTMGRTGRLPNQQIHGARFRILDIEKDSAP